MRAKKDPTQSREWAGKSPGPVRRDKTGSLREPDNQRTYSVTFVLLKIGKFHGGALHGGALRGAGLTTLAAPSFFAHAICESMADGDGGGAAAPVRAKKDGGFGLGKSSGFGTLHNMRFRAPFQLAVDLAVQTHVLPDIMVKDSIVFHISELCVLLFAQIESFYQEAVNKKEEWVQSCKSYSLTNTFRKILVYRRIVTF